MPRHKHVTYTCCTCHVYAQTNSHAHTVHDTIQCTCNIPCVRNTQSSSRCLSQHPRPRRRHTNDPLGAQVHAHAVWEKNTATQIQPSHLTSLEVNTPVCVHVFTTPMHSYAHICTQCMQLQAWTSIKLTQVCRY